MNLSRDYFTAPKVAPIGLSDHAFHRHWLPRECHVEEEKSHDHRRCLRHQSGVGRLARQHVRVRGEQQQPPDQITVLARIFESVVSRADGGRRVLHRIAWGRKSVSIHRVATLCYTRLDRAPAAATHHDHNLDADDHNGGPHDHHCTHDDGGADNDRYTDNNGRIDNDGCSNHNDRGVDHDLSGHDHHRCPHDDGCAHNDDGARRVEAASYPTWLGHQRGCSGCPKREAYRWVAV
jgi:hypothetical protein